jgi:hypothetical protein
LEELVEEHLEYSLAVMGHTVGVPNQVDIRSFVVGLALAAVESALEDLIHQLGPIGLISKVKSIW